MYIFFTTFRPSIYPSIYPSLAGSAVLSSATSKGSSAYGVVGEYTTFQWPASEAARYWRLFLKGKVPKWWVTQFYLYADADCKRQIKPVKVTSGKHHGCCRVGCIKGSSAGSCCCNFFYRSFACSAAGQCYVTYDLGKNTAVGCIRYEAGGGTDQTLILQYKKNGAKSFTDTTKGNPFNPSSIQ